MRPHLETCERNVLLAKIKIHYFVKIITFRSPTFHFRIAYNTISNIVKLITEAVAKKVSKEYLKLR